MQLAATQDLALLERLEKMAEQLEAKRMEMHIPGMALAVVKDDQIVMARGFGLADLENNTPVTPETVFPIGSATKAFTATLAGMLVDDGQLDWDGPITDYLPFFNLDIDSHDQDDQVTIRDLLSHRTGFVRMGILFANSDIPSEEVLHAAVGAEPWAPFREEFHYSNVMYLAAGTATGNAVGSDWDTLVEQRIFGPLGMTSTTTTHEQAETKPRLALGYRWEEALASHQTNEMRSVDNIAPAGAINSNVLDMAQWLRFQLGQGIYEGQRLISERQHQESWTAQINAAPGVDYGLGWILREWEGQPVVEHGGNVPGFTAKVGMLPESNIGFVMLTNLNATHFPQQASNIIWEALGGEYTSEESARATTDFEQYLGKYVANFGDFEDAEVSVLVQNNRLAVEVPGQTVYELKSPDEEGKWYFSLTDAVAVSFDRNDDGDVVGMKLYQGELTFEFPLVGIETAPEIPLDQLEKYLGTYYSDGFALTVEVVIMQNRLAVDWPDQMVYELRPPDADGKRMFRVTDDWSLRFEEETNAQVESFTFSGEGLVHQFNRVLAQSLPTLDEILTLRQTESRKAALMDLGTYRITGSVEIPQSGVTGSFSLHVGGNDRYRVNSSFGPLGEIDQVVSGSNAWTESSWETLRELHGKLLEQAILSHPAAIYGDWRDYADSVRVLRSAELGDRKVHVLRLKRGDLPASNIYVDSATGDVLKSEGVLLTEGNIGTPVVNIYEDYREFRGVRFPFRIISSNESTGNTITQYEIIESNLITEDHFFTLNTDSKD